MQTPSRIATVEIESHFLANALTDYLDILNQKLTTSISNDITTLTGDSFYINVPHDKSEIVDILLEYFKNTFEGLDFLCDIIFENKRKVEKSITYFKIEVSDYTWDNQNKYYEDFYPSKTLKKIKKAIAHDLDCSVKNVSYEDFCDFIAVAKICQKDIFIYNKANDTCKYKRSYELEN